MFLNSPALALLLLIAHSQTVLAAGDHQKKRGTSLLQTTTEVESLGDLQNQLTQTQLQIDALENKRQILQGIQKYRSYFETLAVRKDRLLSIINQPYQIALEQMLRDPIRTTDYYLLNEKELFLEWQRIEAQWPSLNIFLNINTVDLLFSESLRQFRIKLAAQTHGDFDRATAERFASFESEVVKALLRRIDLRNSELFEKTQVSKIEPALSETELRRQMVSHENTLKANLSQPTLEFILIPTLADWFALNLLLRTASLKEEQKSFSPIFKAGVISAFTGFVGIALGQWLDHRGLSMAGATGLGLFAASGQAEEKWGQKLLGWQFKRERAKRMKKLDQEFQTIFNTSCLVLLQKK